MERGSGFCTYSSDQRRRLGEHHKPNHLDKAAACGSRNFRSRIILNRLWHRLTNLKQMTNQEAKQHLARKLNIDYSDIANNDLWTDTDLQTLLQLGIFKAWDY